VASGFTWNHKHLANALVTEVHFSDVLQVHQKQISARTCQALWDTGATTTCISPQVVQDLNLKPITMRQVNGVHGGKLCPVHLVGVILPNNVAIKKLHVIECALGCTDALIGMDIISMGDMTISNFKGKTKFCFRIPSAGEIDLSPKKKKTSPTPGSLRNSKIKVRKDKQEKQIKLKQLEKYEKDGWKKVSD